MIEARGKSHRKALELAAAIHACTLLVGVTWAFGGNADWVRMPLTLWSLVGLLITLASVFPRNKGDSAFSGTLLWATPVAALNVLVALSLLTPGLRNLNLQGGAYISAAPVHWWRPSTADSRLSLWSLLLFDGLYFSSLNIALLVGRRRILRSILGVTVLNAFVLAVFGTVQKLVASEGIYFGAFKSPQTYFFSSFVYDNHWGAFMVLMIGTCIGLVLRYSQGSSGEGFLKGPGLAGIVASILMAISVPYSGARACSALVAVLFLITLGRVVPSWIRQARRGGKDSAGAVGIVIAVVVIGLAGFWFVAGDVIEARAASTRDQVSQMHAQVGAGSRSILYSDTLAMAKGRPAFGWGMGTFPRVFGLFNSQVSRVDRIPVVYHDAHSDWLQSASEIGLVGTALIGLSVFIPFSTIIRRRMSAIPFSIFTACSLVAAYAWVEFPFGNVAVVLSWWICFFVAVQYVRISSTTHSRSPIR